MNSSLTAAIILGVLGAVAGVPLARFAARRATAQPVSLAVDEERTVLAALAADITLFLHVVELKASDFAVDAHRRIWESLVSRYAAVGQPDGITSEAQALAWIEERRSEHAELFAQNPMAELTRAESLQIVALDGDDLPGRIVTAAESVVAAGEDRNVLNGRSPIVAGPDGGPVLVRRYVPTGPVRVAITAAVNAFAWGVAPLLAGEATRGTQAFVFATISLIVLASSSLLWALVDIDTMYLDTPSFWPGAIASWGFAASAAVADHQPGRLIPGLIIAAGGAAVFELANLGYRIVRGTHGMGFGDTLILLATAGVPAALFGSISVGYYSALGSMVLGVIGWVLLFIAGKVRRDSHFAFGPYLALGWLATCLVWLVL